MRAFLAIAPVHLNSPPSFPLLLHLRIISAVPADSAGLSASFKESPLSLGRHLAVTSTKPSMVRTRAQAYAKRMIFPLLELPGETRHTIYRSFLDDITAPTKEFDLWSTELPEYRHMANYAFLLCVSKLVNFEVKTLFEKEYLSEMPLFFDSLHSLYAFVAQIDMSAPIRAGAEYVLRAPIGRTYCTGIRGAEAIAGDDVFTLKNFPVEVWKILEDVSKEGLKGEENLRRVWKNGAAIEVKGSTEQLSCAVQVPLRRYVETYPRLTCLSRIKRGAEGETTATIKGRLRDLLHKDAWYRSDFAQFPGTADVWESALESKERIATCFDDWESAEAMRLMLSH